MNKRGSIMVDAAISLPLFIIALAMLLSVIGFAGKEEKNYYTAINAIFLKGNLESDLDVGRIVDDPNRGIYIDHVRSIPLAEMNSFPFGGAFFKSAPTVMDLPYRSYIGESPLKYDDDDVIIFPKNEGAVSDKYGELDKDAKYHTENCRIIKGGITKNLKMEQVSKAEAEKRGYTICYWCTQIAGGKK